MKSQSTENTPSKGKLKKGKKKMDTSFWILFILTLILIFISYFRKGSWDLPREGLVQAGRMFWDLAPNLLLGFALAGVVQVMVPKEYIGRMIGEGSSFKGILIATVAGALNPGGPYINIPLVASLYHSGASVGPLAAFLTSWGLIPISRTLVYEIPMLGTTFALARFIASVIFPCIIGVLTSFIFKLLK